MSCEIKLKNRFWYESELVYLVKVERDRGGEVV